MSAQPSGGATRLGWFLRRGRAGIASVLDGGVDFVSGRYRHAAQALAGEGLRRWSITHRGAQAAGWHQD